MLNRFVEENLTKTEHFIKIPAKEVYKRYLMFCHHHQIRPFGKKTLYSQLESRGIIREGTISRINFKGWFLKSCKY